MNTMTHDRIGESRAANRMPRFGRLRRLALATFESAQFVTEALREAAQKRRVRRAILRQRRVLAQLDERTLKDIGVHRAEIDSLSAELGGHAEATRRRMRENPVAPLY